MLNYYACFCQLLLLIFFTFLGCTTRDVEDFEPQEAVAVWHNVPKQFSFLNTDGQPPIHMFFDLAPFISIRDRELNFVPLNSPGPQYVYALDLQSGRPFKNHVTCRQEDIWNNYKGPISLPSYTNGFVPRMLDQLGRPLEIYVFGRGNFYKKVSLKENKSYRVRVVAGVILHECRQRPCRGKYGWMGRLALIAIDPLDYDFREVQTIKELKKEVSWSEFKAQVQNSKGRFVVGKSDYKTTRWIATVESKQALMSSIKLGKYFKFDQMMSMRKSCHALYDYIWSKIEQIKKGEVTTQKEESFRRLKETFEGKTVIEQEQIDKPLPKALPTLKDFMQQFQKKMLVKFNTCHKYVRASNINDSSSRHWFFMALSAFAKTQQMGYAYNCNRRSWVSNPRREDNSFSVDPYKESWPCTIENFLYSFEQIPRVLSNRRIGGYEHYIYIDYDSEIGGTHQKIHNLVFIDGKRALCTDKSKHEKLSMDYINREVYPGDWGMREFLRNEINKSDLIR